MPILRLGPLALPAYGLMMSITILCAVQLGTRQAAKFGLDRDAVYLDTSLAILAALLGARIFDLAMRRASLRDAAAIFISGAGTFLFGFICAGFVVLIQTWRRRVSFWALADSGALSLALGVCIVRIGCFLSGCDYGKPTNVAWGVVFTNPLTAQLAGTPLNVKLHPSQLYESLLGLGFFLLLLFLSRRARPSGALFATFALGYAIGRFFLEFFRGDTDRLFWGPFSTSQWLSLLIAGLVVALYPLPRTRKPMASPTVALNPSRTPTHA